MYTIQNKQLWLTNLKNDSVIETLIELQKVTTKEECYVNTSYIKQLLYLCSQQFVKVDYFTSYEQYQYFVNNVNYGDYDFTIGEISHQLANKIFTFKTLSCKQHQQHYLLACCYNAQQLITLFNLDISLKKGERNHFKNIIQHEHLVDCLYRYGRRYLNNVNKLTYDNKLKALNDVVAKHKHYFFKPENNVSTLENQLALLQIYEKHLKQYGSYLRVEQLTMEEMLDAVVLKQHVANVFKKDNRQLCKPLTNLPQMSGGWEVKQLNTMLDLIEEGQFQHHCIGSSNYSYAIRRNNGVAVSLRKHNKRHTVFFRFEKSKLKWSIEQDLTFANKDKKEVFDDYDVKLLDYNIQVLLEYLNKERVKPKKMVEELF